MGVWLSLLDNYMEEKFEIENQEIAQLRDKFQTALDNCKVVFEDDVFLDVTRDRPKQGMIHYDLLMGTVGLLDRQLVLDKKEEIKSAYSELCLSDGFRKTLSSGTQKKTSIIRRRKLWGALLDAAIK